MAAGGFINRTNKYWFWQAECAHELSLVYLDSRWEQLMYWYLFKWAGYEE
jgi:hypothetical protein